MPIYIESFVLEPSQEGTLQHRIKRLIIEAILSGRFRAGERMPSSRKLARHLGVGRITVTLAYNDLVADDYLSARGRSGYFVSETAPTAPDFALNLDQADSVIDWQRLLGQRADPVNPIERPVDWQSYPYPFIYGQTDPKLFDHQNWRRCALLALGQREFDSLTSDQYERDDPKLVDYILRHILTRRGINARPENILITLGAQNALWLCAQMLLTQRRTAAIENPCYPGLRQVLAQTRCRVRSIDVDEDGLPPEAIPSDVDVVFVTASHHCPTNVTMSMDRRRKLLQLSAERRFVIVEDDYEFELAFQRSPSPALKSFDAAGTVVYIGSFSKSLFPGLRLGYIVAPSALIQEARSIRTAVLRHPPGMIQRTVAHFLSLGHYDAQLNRMRKAYSRRRQIMGQAFDDKGLSVATRDHAGGSCFWMKAPQHVDTAELARNLHPRGVVIEPGHAFFNPKSCPKNYYRLAYSSISSARIPVGIDLIAKEIASSGITTAN